MRRQHGRERDQSERSGRIARADQLAGLREIPEIVCLEARIDHQHVACARRRHWDFAHYCCNNPVCADRLWARKILLSLDAYE